MCEEGEHKAIDVFVLFILHSISSRKRSVETLFCSKIRSRLFTDDLMATVFGAHAGVGPGGHCMRCGIGSVLSEQGSGRGEG